MAVGISPITSFNDTPYLTIAEYKNAPTSIDFSNLVVGGNSAAQDAELANIILRASSFMDTELSQNLNASVQTETARVRITPEGYVALHPSSNPVIALESFLYGSDPNNLQTLTDCSRAWFEDEQIIIPLSQMTSTTSSIGPLSFSGFGSSRSRLFTKYSYASGFVNNAISSATATASTMTMTNAAGIVAGMTLRIPDGASSETATVASTYVYGSTTVPLTAALAFSHASGVPASNMPNAVKEACVLITTALIKARGDSSMTMAITTQANASQSAANLYGSDIATAFEMIQTYRRTR